MNEFECKYFFEPNKKPSDFVKSVEVTDVTELYDILKENNIKSDTKWYPYPSDNCLYNNYHKPIELKNSVHLEQRIELSEAEFDTIFKYDGPDKLITHLHGQWFEINQLDFKNRYSQVYPKYTFPKQCIINLFLLDKQPITSN